MNTGYLCNSMKLVRTWIKTLSAVLVFAIAGALWAQEESLTLTVQVSGAKPGVGQAIFSLFNSKKTFLETPLQSLEKPIDENGAAEFRVPGIMPGTYAVAIVYDEDNSGDLNTGLFGIPTEKVGVSNNHTPRFGPPSYRKSSFEMTESMTLQIFLQGVE